MKVQINHNEISEGVLFKKTYHQIVLTIQFSEEELQLIKENGLEDVVVIELPFDDLQIKRNLPQILDDVHLRIRDLLPSKKGKVPTNSRHYLDLAAAKQYESLLHKVLPQLKDYIMSYSVGIAKSQSFEL